jgi:hypothetical protein
MCLKTDPGIHIDMHLLLFGKTSVTSGVKHMITERSASARISIVALHPVVFGLSYLYFPKGGTTTKMIE